jgi:hypothetical protein
MLVIWTPKQPPRSWCALKPRSCNTTICLWLCLPSWAPGCMTFRGWCALVGLPASSGHPGFYVGNEGLPVGCAPGGPAKCFRVLEHFYFETFLRSACLGWLCQTLCSYAGYLDVSTLQSFKIDITPTTSSSTISTTTDDHFIRHTFQDPVGYPRIQDIIDLRPF